MKLIFAPIIAAVLVGSASAAITTSGNFKTGFRTPTLTITEDITFLITRDGGIGGLIFDEWVIYDGSGTVVTATQGLAAYKINDGPTQLVAVSFLADNRAYGSAVSENDGYLAISEAVSVLAGDKVTFLGGTSFTFDYSPQFNQPPALFSGSAFLTDRNGIPVSNSVSVPEPAVSLLSVMGTLALLRRRR